MVKLSKDGVNATPYSLDSAFEEARRLPESRRQG